MAKKKTDTSTAANASEKLQMELAEKGLSSLLRKIDEYEDLNVTCISTGYPSLDRALHPTKLGLPLGRDIELYSRDPECGKTSIALDILRSYQRQGLKTAIIDVEGTITRDYLVEQGIMVDPEDNPDWYVPFFMENSDEQGNPIPAEVILDTIRGASAVCDLVIVDSVAALSQRADLEKSADDADKVGGVSKLLNSHVRKNVSKKATVIWINQMRQQIGGYNPTGNIRYNTVGGKALPFFDTIRLELSLIEKLKDNQENVYGVRVNFHIAKNKVAPPYKNVVLTYLNGEGFSLIYDYLDAGLKSGIIVKSGSWLTYGDLRVQGLLSMHKALRENPLACEQLRIELEKV